MSYRGMWVGVLVVLSATLAARAQVKVVSERNEGDRATAGFKFKEVPAPMRGDVAAKAKFTLVDGVRDPNGGDLDVLTNGRLPGEEDAPADSFFFRAGTDGGRIAADLGAVIDIKRVSSYSWHANTRAPQVYKLYASDGSAGGFDAKPKKVTDPEKCGWKLVATVDTRPKTGDVGGQYGVNIADPAGTLGKYRYLLLDISRTESEDAFGNTFFNEIDVIDAAAPVVAEAPEAPADPAAGKLVVVTEEDKYQITIDYSEMPEFKEWVETKLAPALVKWYPVWVKELPSEGFTAPKAFKVVFRKNMQGVANTSRGTLVTCAGPWFKQNLNGEAVGAVVHEAVHVAQQYRGRGTPGWLMEGLTDYLRWFKFEPESQRPRPNPARAKYTDSYRVTAAFLNYLVEKHDKQIIQKLNVVMRQGKYTPEVWKEITGKTVEELWEEYMVTLRK